MAANKIDQARRESPGPFFLYDLDFLKSHLEGISSDGVRLWYACKANPLGAILGVCRDRGFSFDVASPGELAQALRCGVAGKNILVTGPSRPEKFLLAALRAGVAHFVVESPRQLQELNQQASRLGVCVKALLRLQLDWQGGEASVLGGSKVTPFGVDADLWREAKPASTPQVELIGFHAFQWGNILSVGRLVQIWRRVASLARELANEFELKLDVLDLGGGIGIPYKSGDSRPLWREVAIALGDLRREYALPEIWLELGRYAVGEAGIYVASVVDRKRVRGKELLVLDGGINHLARPALVHESFPAKLVRTTSAKDLLFGVHGPLCTSLDHFGDYELPGDIAPGDLLQFGQCGAYGFTESMPYFLGHDLPAEFVWHNNALSCVRNAESAATWMK